MSFYKVNYPKRAVRFIKKLVFIWDPAYTKLTSSERKSLRQAEQDLIKGDTVSHNEINWD